MHFGFTVCGLIVVLMLLETTNQQMNLLNPLLADVYRKFSELNTDLTTTAFFLAKKNDAK